MAVCSVDAINCHKLYSGWKAQLSASSILTMFWNTPAYKCTLTKKQW